MNGEPVHAPVWKTVEQLERTHLVTTARKLERLMARRRKLLITLADYDGQILRVRKLIRDLTTVVGDDAYRPEEPPVPCPDHRFGDRGICFTCGAPRE